MVEIMHRDKHLLLKRKRFSKKLQLKQVKHIRYLIGSWTMIRKLLAVIGVRWLVQMEKP